MGGCHGGCKRPALKVPGGVRTCGKMGIVCGLGTKFPIYGVQDLCADILLSSFPTICCSYLQQTFGIGTLYPALQMYKLRNKDLK